MGDSLTFSVDADDTIARLSRLTDDMRAALVDVEHVLLDAFLENVAAKAPDRTGEYRSRIGGEVVSDETGVIADAYDTDYKASWLEYGVVIPAHEILPNIAQAMSFFDGGQHIFAKRVESPGGYVKPENIFHGTLNEMADEIIDRISQAVDDAMSGF